ncbi:MAG: hypothetical protein HY904_02785 [Deltaproteobacteria bacterium]|nr:hypothetical protein [Deltaproteobacteria bacterium]
MRAASALWAAGDEGRDLRVPIAWALVDIFGAGVTDEELVEMTAVLHGLELQHVPRSAAGALR